MSYPTKLRELAESLRECEWNHPIDAASTCENAADMIQKYTEMLISYIGLLDDTGYSDEARDVERWIDVWEQVEDKPVTDNDLVDRLAEWCKLGEQGYERIKCHPCNTRWLKTEGCLTVEWRPLDSDDDCRVVLETLSPKQRAFVAAWLAGTVPESMFDDTGLDWDDVAELLTASPREKCEAVAKVMGWD